MPLNVNIPFVLRMWTSMTYTEFPVKMNVKKSVGYDDIPCKFLTIGATPLAGILCQMVNISLENVISQICYNMI